MKLILTMVVLAIALSSGGCASRRAANAAAKAAKADNIAAAKAAKAAPASNVATAAAPAPVTYAVAAAPAASATVAGKPGVMPVAASAAAPSNVEKVPFQVGTSSVTVERMAKTQGCVGGKGASLVTEKGPVEVYRMQCDDGKVFLAKCELRQCAPMRW